MSGDGWGVDRGRPKRYRSGGPGKGRVIGAAVRHRTGVLRVRYAARAVTQTNASINAIVPLYLNRVCRVASWEREGVITTGKSVRVCAGDDRPDARRIVVIDGWRVGNECAMVKMIPSDVCRGLGSRTNPLSLCGVVSCKTCSTTLDRLI